MRLLLLAAALVGACTWVDAHDPVVPSTMTASCTGLGEERCGRGGCCDGWHDEHCNAVAERCEYHSSTPGPARHASDGGAS